MTPEEQKVTGEALQRALVDLIGLALQSKQAHWNLTGPHFRSIHLHLDEVVATAREHTDTLAERAVAIGVNPDGRAATVARDTSAPFGEGPVPDSEVITRMVQLLAEIVGRLREGVKETAEADPVSQDLLISAEHDLRKHHWMFAAQAK
ncbi:Dps family protein [Allorhizocola rhizosphaerae]|uniref:Dps family protein n=1 Tax=Allorhizocola rhizosphaerae TaxID=1872709 RepID=UPI000E3EC6DA|nr:DNA starvation/stationary phase protection protein [Allorhizocola rhizosphaerae]